ncbi:hypothetical protein ABIA69_001323 [Lysinibacillus parviboronicapiens]|uniref:Lipoprotein n=1 Tax=Lysinibacillus parviboronicapiens TaxID=436516 RepID=A0ABV2PHU5_9BACI|nr:hypothetical protein [Lysinibacillus parviboronicapiens]
MKKWIMLSFLVVLSAGCQSSIFGGSKTIIDWVDFIKWDGKGLFNVNLLIEGPDLEKGDVQWIISKKC